MPAIDLEVPYQEKELAKALGARWDSRPKVWYVIVIEAKLKSSPGGR